MSVSAILETTDLEEVLNTIYKKAQEQPGLIVLLQGELGAGKTHLVKEYMRRFYKQNAASPTFTILRVYKAGADVVAHFDLYRFLDFSEEELQGAFEEIGFWDYVGNVLSFIEWPQPIANMLKDLGLNILQVKISRNLNGDPKYSVYAY